MLENDTNQFIEPKYLPRGMKLKDPRNMTKAHLLAVTEHINARDDKYGTHDAFQFKKYYDGTKLVPAENRDLDGQNNVDEERATARAEKARAASKARKARTQKAKVSKGKQREGPQAPQPLNPGEQSRRLQPSNIDPRLLAADTRRPGDTDRDFDSEPEGPTRQIGSVEMEVLLKLGHPPVVPMNGPNDRLPQYQVDTAAYQFYMSPLQSQHKEAMPDRSSVQEAVSRSSGRPRQRQPKTDNKPTANSGKNTRSRARHTAEAESSIRKSTRSQTRGRR